MRFLIALLLICVPVSAVDKKELSQRYKGKFIVVLRDGLAIGSCANHPTARGLFNTEIPELAVRISGDEAEFHIQTGLSAMGNECGAITPEPLRKGEVLRVDHTFFYRGRDFTIVVDNVSPHQIERGQGSASHTSFERGRADLIFKADDPKDYEAVQALVEKWVKVFDTQDQAARFGNTASGVFVKEVKAGMTFEEVESALGPPQTRVDLGEKVLYKYKDMTVEFHDGKVADVK